MPGWMIIGAPEASLMPCGNMRGSPGPGGGGVPYRTQVGWGVDLLGGEYGVSLSLKGWVVVVCGVDLMRRWGWGVFNQASKPSAREFHPYPPIRPPTPLGIAFRALTPVVSDATKGLLTSMRLMGKLEATTEREIDTSTPPHQLRVMSCPHGFIRGTARR
eukprot:751038-Hanusia_phi.AAC.11